MSSILAVAQAVNNWSKLGRWRFHVCKDPQMLGHEFSYQKKAAGSS